MDTLSPLTAQIDFGGTWRMSLFIGTLLGAAAFVYQLRGKISWPLRALGLYLLAYSLFLIEFPGAQFGAYNTAFQATAGQTVMELLFTFYLAKSWPNLIFRILPLVIWYEIFAVWLHFEGLLVAPSFDTAFLALYLPFAMPGIAIASVLTILFHHGSTALMILGFQLLALTLTKVIRPWVIIAVGILLIGVGILHSHGPMLDGSDRIAHYKEYLSLWSKEWWTILFGIGPGTFMWCSLLLSEFKGDLYLSMHSDVIQILFELGLVGMTLAGLAVFKATKSAWNNPRLLTAIFGAVAFSLTYHPMRWFPTALLMALIFTNEDSGQESLSYKRM